MNSRGLAGGRAPGRLSGRRWAGATVRVRVQGPRRRGGGKERDGGRGASGV